MASVVNTPYWVPKSTGEFRCHKKETKCPNNCLTVPDNVQGLTNPNSVDTTTTIEQFIALGDS